MPEKKKRTLRDYRKRILIGVVGCITVLILFTVSWPKIRLLYWQWQLNQAQNRWEQNEPDHYRYRVMICGSRCFHQFIIINNGEIMEAFEWQFNNDSTISEVPVEDLSKIESLMIEYQFQAVQRNLDNDANYGVEYDNHYGYPKVITYHFCDFVSKNPITGLCEPYHSKQFIGEFEVLSDE